MAKLLLAALTNDAPTVFRPVDRTRVQTKIETSHVVSGASYYWGAYRPRNTGDVQWYALVGVKGGEPREIRMTSDWATFVSPWWPTSAGGAIAACSELLRVTGARRDPLKPPVIYVDSGSLKSVFGRPSGALPRWISSPRTDGSPQAGLWTVVFAVFEPGRAAQYECRWQHDHAPSLTVTDSLPGAGLLPAGP